MDILLKVKRQNNANDFGRSFMDAGIATCSDYPEADLLEFLEKCQEFIEGDVRDEGYEKRVEGNKRKIFKLLDALEDGEYGTHKRM